MIIAKNEGAMKKNVIGLNGHNKIKSDPITEVLGRCVKT